MSKIKFRPKTKDELKDLICDVEILLEDIDTSCITDMSGLFDMYNLVTRKDFKGIEFWDVSGVVDMNRMFFGCGDFNQDISKWNVKNVRNMEKMFAGCSKFNIDLSNWNVAKVTNMSNMFSGCKNFNQDISRWEVSSVKTISYMFDECQSFDQNLSNWDVSSVLDMSNTFRRCASFNSKLSKWNVSQVRVMGGMFNRCKNFNQDISSWNVANAIDMRYMFLKCTNFNQDLSNWSLKRVKNVRNMFLECGIKTEHKPKILIDIFDDKGIKVGIFDMVSRLVDYENMPQKPKDNTLTNEQSKHINSFVENYNNALEDAKKNGIRLAFYCYKDEIKTYTSKYILKGDSMKKEMGGLGEMIKIFRKKIEKNYLPNLLEISIKQIKHESKYIDDSKYKNKLSLLKMSFQNIHDEIDKQFNINTKLSKLERQYHKIYLSSNKKTKKEIKKFHKLYKKLEKAIFKYDKYVTLHLDTIYF